jgi:Uri superfamily endonuclease
MAGYRGRLGRHFSQEKRLRWHIDYLLQEAEPVGAFLVHGGAGMECSCISHLYRIDESSIPSLTGEIGKLSWRMAPPPEND